MNRFRDEFDLDDSAEAAAHSFGDVDAETLVKDYWVTESLRALALAHGDCFAFKGGTSLTKAVGCVDRFSEDLDILVTDKPDDVSLRSRLRRASLVVQAEPIDEGLVVGSMLGSGY